MLFLGLSRRLVGDREDFGWTVGDRGYRREALVRYLCYFLHPECQDHTNKGLLCLVGRMARGNRRGRNFFCFQERGKCCTIFDFENCAALISLEALMISAEHPLESKCLFVWHPLEDVDFSAKHLLENKKVS